MSDNRIPPGRVFGEFAVLATPELKQQMLNWAAPFNICCFMDNHDYSPSHHAYECLLAAGAWRWVDLKAGTAIDRLRLFATHADDWLFGHLGFGLQAETMGVEHLQTDPSGFADGAFFVPEHLLLLKEGKLLISSYSLPADHLLQTILRQPFYREPPTEQPVFEPGYSRTEYIQLIQQLQKHILRGDCYEINFCQPFTAQPVKIDPVAAFLRLSALSPTPFSVFYRQGDSYCLCASPERYFCIDGREVWSQPIKGTAKREPEPEADRQTAARLRSSAKEQAENVMVVDLVRNDLSRVCEPGSVKVEELFGVYAYPKVHQMMSTIRGQLRPGLDWVDLVQSSFPMGSMTGAPKKRVLELIARYEKTARGIFSGSIGYVTADGRADFNVVIRSLMYQAERGWLSYSVGSGITGYAEAEAEYEECLLKADAIRAVWSSEPVTTKK